MRNAILNVCLVFLVYALLLLWWEVRFEGKYELLYSSPTKVYEYMVREWSDLSVHFRYSAAHVLVPALPLGVALGALLGSFAATFRQFRLALLIAIGLIWALPRMAVMLWMSEVYGDTESTILFFNTYACALIGLYVSFRGAIGVIDGFGSVNTDTSDAARQYLRNRFAYFTKYVLPLTIPHVFTAYYLAALATWQGLIFVESVISIVEPGLGTVVYLSIEQSIRLEEFFAAAFLLALGNLLTWLLIRVVEMLYRKVMFG